MADTFLLEVATPEKLLIREQVSEAQIPALDGYLGILPQHAALLSEMGSGELSYTMGGQKHSIVVGGGWVEVLDDQTRVLASVAEKPNEIDAKRAAEAVMRAEERLNTLPAGLDVPRALNAMKRAQARLALADKK